VRADPHQSHQLSAVGRRAGAVSNGGCDQDAAEPADVRFRRHDMGVDPLAGRILGHAARLYQNPLTCRSLRGRCSHSGRRPPLVLTEPIPRAASAAPVEVPRKPRPLLALVEQAGAAGTAEQLAAVDWLRKLLAEGDRARIHCGGGIAPPPDTARVTQQRRRRYSKVQLSHWVHCEDSAAAGLPASGGK